MNFLELFGFVKRNNPDNENIKKNLNKERPAKEQHRREQRIKRKLSKRDLCMIVLKTSLVLFLTVASIFSGVLLGAAMGYISTSDPITDDMLNLKTESTIIYDKDGNIIKELTSTINKNIIFITYEESPDYLRNAFIAIEDKRFENHTGVDLIRTANAILDLFKTGRGSGGSTITQQLVKNVSGDDSNSIPRKIREVWRAMQLDSRLDKNEIITYYMNIIYMGYDIYGVEAAARAYFNKNAIDLDLAECAFIAGITNNPSVYNPFTTKGRENTKKRQELILDQMHLQEYITKEQCEEAKAKELIFFENYKNVMNQGNKISYFVEQVISEVRSELMDKHNKTRSEANNIIYGGGAEIYTTLDMNVQNALDTVYTTPESFPYNVANKDELELIPDNRVQSAMVVIDPQNGQIRGLYGGSGEKTINYGLNRATQINRQPGSTLKPIMIYGPLLDNGDITLATVRDDCPQYLDPNNPSRIYPKNSNDEFKGIMTIQTALAESENVIPATLFRDNMDFCLESLKKAGIDITDERNVATALGGLSKGLNPLNIAAAYVPYANEGFYFKPTCVLKMLNKDKSVLIDHTPEQRDEASSIWKGSLVCNDQSTPYLMTKAMMATITEGTAKGKINIKDNKGGNVEVAGKTGTTDNNKDSWFAGYTPKYVAATWYGFDDNESLPPADRSQSVFIWNEVMKEIHKNEDPVSFPSSNRIEDRQICKYSGKLATEHCKHDPRGNQTTTIYFSKNKSNIPTENCDCHIQISLCSETNLLKNASCPSAYSKTVLTNRPINYIKHGDAPDPKDLQYVTNLPNECNVHTLTQDDPTDIGTSPVTSPPATTSPASSAVNQSTPPGTGSTSTDPATVPAHTPPSSIPPIEDPLAATAPPHIYH